MHYTVTITVVAPRKLTETQLAAAVELGGVASGEVGHRELTVMFTQPAIGPNDAVTRALNRLENALDDEFHLVAIEVMTTDEADRRILIRS